jgi:hypothetical protein
LDNLDVLSIPFFRWHWLAIEQFQCDQFKHTSCIYIYIIISGWWCFCDDYDYIILLLVVILLLLLLLVFLVHRYSDHRFCTNYHSH